MKVLVGAFNQEKALVGAFSVIVLPGIASWHNLAPSSTIISDYLPQWESGYATKLLLNIGGDMKQMSAVNGDYNIAGGQSCRFSGLRWHDNPPM